MTNKFTLETGACAPDITTQCKSQGFGISEKDADRMEKLNDSITRLYFAGYIPRAIMHKSRQKLALEISKCLTVGDYNEK
jgi:hypothetical protein